MAAWLLFFLVTTMPALAKRGPPPEVPPVLRDGVRYEAPNDDHNEVSVEAHDASTGALLWKQVVFILSIDMPEMEADVQWVFIAHLGIEGGMLIVTDERRRRYAVDLRTHAVRRLTSR